MSDLSGDLRYAFRGLRRSPLFAAIAVLTLALGIGATTAIFTLIDQVVLRRLPVPTPAPWCRSTRKGRTTAATWAAG